MDPKRAPGCPGMEWTAVVLPIAMAEFVRRRSGVGTRWVCGKRARGRGSSGGWRDVVGAAVVARMAKTGEGASDSCFSLMAYRIVVRCSRARLL
jgi:hypothetical protein